MLKTLSNKIRLVGWVSGSVKVLVGDKLIKDLGSKVALGNITVLLEPFNIIQKRFFWLLFDDESKRRRRET